jgi:hypothetical protein
MTFDLLNEPLAWLVLVALGFLATGLTQLFRYAGRAIDLWFERQIAGMPDNVQRYYEIAARLLADYVDQLVKSGQLEREAEKMIDAAIEAGEKLLKQLGLKNADLDVLRVYIEAYLKNRNSVEITIADE